MIEAVTRQSVLMMDKIYQALAVPLPPQSRAHPHPPLKSNL